MSTNNIYIFVVKGEKYLSGYPSPVEQLQGLMFLSQDQKYHLAATSSYPVYCFSNTCRFIRTLSPDFMKWTIISEC